ncbi:hypothetical protein [Rubrivirga sp.]|uniref:hypothetical protein n=1 Tax=Rubrivirga sp. TaxID=1885344 RepID=UPI003C71B108
MRYILLAAFVAAAPLAAQSIVVEVESGPGIDIRPDAFGIQYHGETYNAPLALEKLSALPLSGVRIWAYPSQFHPRPGVWEWADLDRKINEVVAAGYEPWVCLFQAETWYDGTPDDPWWTRSAPRVEWSLTAEALARRYSDRVDRWIVFDEVNILHPSRPAYMSPTLAAELYVEAARAIQAGDAGAWVGGPSNFAGWENGYWAQRVLGLSGGADALDFVSSNLFLSWNAADSDQHIMDRTIWYEEAALNIREMIGGADDPLLVLDAYNASALWTRDGTSSGELWTDPRNVNTFGGVYQTLAQLHALQGGFDVLLRWETLGGFGILEWFPAFNERIPYYAWQLTAGPGRLRPGSSVLRAKTTEPPIDDLPHHGGQNVAGYHVQPFAVADENGTSVFLINKYDESRTVTLRAPHDASAVDVYRFSDGRHAESLVAIESHSSVVADSDLQLDLPGVSVTVISFASSRATAVSAARPASGARLLPPVPNPSFGATTLVLEADSRTDATLDVWTVTGRHVRALFSGALAAGRRSVEVGPLPAGTYVARLCSDAGCTSVPIVRAR